MATITVTTELGDRPAPPQYGEVLTDTRDGNTYKTVQLADQLWMAENLRYLPEQQFDVSSTEPRYYVMFDNDAKTELGKAYLKTYGAYYNLPAALQSEIASGENETRNIKGVCPDGWHIPSQKEWQTLSKYVLDSGMAAIMSDGQVDETAIAKALASTTMWMLPEYTEIEPQPTWVGVEMEKNNATLFNGLPSDSVHVQVMKTGCIPATVLAGGVRQLEYKWDLNSVSPYVCGQTFTHL